MGGHAKTYGILRPGAVLDLGPAYSVDQYKREPVMLAYSAPAGSSGELTRAILDECTVERCLIRIYPGGEGTLQLRPVIRDRVGRETPLVSFGDPPANQYVGGDADAWPCAPRIPAGPEHKIVVHYSNTDAVNPHAFVVLLELDYAGGRYPLEVLSAIAHNGEGV